MKVYCSGIYDSAKLALEKSSESGNGLLLDEESFSACESESIDYAVLEHYENLKLVELSCDWSDVGSWNSLKPNFFLKTRIAIVLIQTKHYFLTQRIHSCIHQPSGQ